MEIKVKQIPGVILPNRAHLDDAGYDIIATSGPNIIGEKIDDVCYKSIDYVEYGTNLFVEPRSCGFLLGSVHPPSLENLENEAPFHYEEYFTKHYHIDIRPRSSICKYNLLLKNSPATIDRGYRGEIKLRFAYLWQPEDYYVSPRCFVAGIPNTKKIYQIGDKIAQLLPCQTIDAHFELVEELSETKRSQNGFGSTGK